MISLDQTVDMQLVPGRSHKTHVVGDTAAAPEVARLALDVAQRFGDAVAAKDFSAAYALIATETRGKTPLQKFVADLTTADSQFGGPPIAYEHDNITWLYADAAAQALNNSEGKWPKEMPIHNKRATVIGFMVTRKDPDGTYGRSIKLWVSEGAEGYRISKISQYDQ